MTKGELIKALEPFYDEIEIYKSLYNREGDIIGQKPISNITYSYDVSNTSSTKDVGQVTLT